MMHTRGTSVQHPRNIQECSSQVSAMCSESPSLGLHRNMRPHYCPITAVRRLSTPSNTAKAIWQPPHTTRRVTSGTISLRRPQESTRTSRTSTPEVSACGHACSTHDETGSAEGVEVEAVSGAEVEGGVEIGVEAVSGAEVEGGVEMGVEAVPGAEVKGGKEVDSGRRGGSACKGSLWLERTAQRGESA
mmetsp:Transcript_12563/g.22218  ORF Transcript_12563/g.22218 Transcript_12563/m.22218 type:complete len:189 (+) Transcript_12563:546-1112(+)